MTPSLVGKSILAFGIMMVVGSIAGAFFLDIFVIDIVAFIVIALGIKVIRKSPSAVKWSIGFMVYYIIMGIGAIILLWCGPESLMNSIQISLYESTWITTIITALITWCGLNIAILISLLRTKQWFAGNPQ